MRRTTKLDGKITKRGIITPDKHFPLHDQKAINVLIKATISASSVEPAFSPNALAHNLHNLIH